MHSILTSKIDPEQISTSAYRAIRNFAHAEAGIELGPSRQMLVISRLRKRLLHNRVDNFDAYAAILDNPQNALERQVAIDLLSTNETYFFRESEHFQVLRSRVLETHPRRERLRIWSAACSSGEEAYSIAMVLADYFGFGIRWEIFGSDISSRMLRQAQQGLYPMQGVDAISPEFRKLYCLRGIGEYTGRFLVDRRLRERTTFDQVNLVKPLPDIGDFDVIFFRNALIYFDDETKAAVMRRILSKLRPGGMLFIGHSESLKRMGLPLEAVAPTAYRKSGKG